LVTDLPDYTRLVVLNVNVALPGPFEVIAHQPFEVIARPTGGVHEFGSVVTTSAWASVCSHVVSDGAAFQLAKTLVSCDEDVLYRILWDGVAVSPEILVPAKTPFPDWYPWDWEDMVGDGSAAIVIQAKYPSGGFAGTCNAEIVGEES
jgi:hypothetical protein